MHADPLLIGLSTLQGCKSSPAGAPKTRMLAWLVALTYLTRLLFVACMDPPVGSLASEAGQLDTGAGLLPEILFRVFSHLDLGEVYQARGVSSQFYDIAWEFLMPVYGIQHEGKISWDYSKMLDKRNQLVQHAERDHTLAEATAILQKSADYLFLDSILRADLGDWIRYKNDNLLEVLFCNMDVFIEDCRISALPYILDHGVAFSVWIHYICGLADFGRFDLLGSMMFQKIEPWSFKELMRVFLPISIVKTAVKSLQNSFPEDDLVQVLGFAGFDDQIYPLPAHWKAPLFMLRLMDENGISIPKDCEFYDGLGQDSISFWMYVLTKESGKAMELMRLVSEQGDDKTRLLARAFLEPVSESSLNVIERDADKDLEIDLYRAMLLRFTCTFTDNLQIYQNYEAAIRGHVSVGYHFARAHVDCQKFGLLRWADITNLSYTSFEALAVRMYLIKEGDKSAFIRKCHRGLGYRVPSLLKRLVRKKARVSYIQSLWDVIYNRNLLNSLEADFCRAPLSVLQQLALAQNISADSIKEMLSAAYENTVLHEGVPISAYFLYTSIFWEVPERVVEQLLVLVPATYQFEFGYVCTDLALKNYSNELCEKLFARIEFAEDSEVESLQSEIEVLRPEFVEKLGFFQ